MTDEPCLTSVDKAIRVMFNARFFLLLLFTGNSTSLGENVTGSEKTIGPGLPASRLWKRQSCLLVLPRYTMPLCMYGTKSNDSTVV